MSEKPVSHQERARLLCEAEEAFDGADQRQRSSGYSPGFAQDFLQEAADMFGTAAVRYQKAGLGMKAREAWERAAECHRELAKLEIHWAALCRDRRDEVPVLWEDSANE
jgi:hypothetical protein